MTRGARSLLERLCLIFAVWTVVVLAVAGNCYIYGVLGAEEGISFLESFRRAMPTWYGWAVLTPLVLWLARRLRLTPERWLWRSAMLLAAGVAVSSLEMSFESYFAALGSESPWLGAASSAEVMRLALRRLPVHLGVFGAIVVVWYLATYYRRYRERELRTAQLETQLAVAELRALKMQLHPHFVLNALNATTAMIARDPERAEEMVVRIGELLRMALDSREAHLVPLAVEIEALRKYLEIERVRFGDQLDVHVDVAPALGDALVPGFVLQPFVENSIKHRSLRPGTPTRVDIQAWEEGSRLHLRVADNGSGLPGRDSQRPAGMGIANTRARLDALFGDRYALSFEPAVPSGLVVDLALPHQTQSASEAVPPGSAA